MDFLCSTKKKKNALEGEEKKYSTRAKTGSFKCHFDVNRGSAGEKSRRKTVERINVEEGMRTIIDKGKTDTR